MANYTTSPQRVEMLDSVSVRDFDGFMTDLTLYIGRESDRIFYYVTFGDRDIYSPGEGYDELVTESYDEAYEFFVNYEGYDECQEV